MAFVNLLLDLAASSSSQCCFRNNLFSEAYRLHVNPPIIVPNSPIPSSVDLETSRKSFICSSTFTIGCTDHCSAVRRWRVNASPARVVDTNFNANGQSSTLACVDIPVTCYQIIGVPDQAEKDQIVKAVMELNNADVEEGYTMESVVARRDLLMDVRDKLLFEPQYAGNTRENIPPRSSLRIPWAWLPGALCVLQEVGEEKFVLDIGRTSLDSSDAKPYVHDLHLSMALAECAIAKLKLEKNEVSEGFDALARAQCHLRSESSLGNLNLLSQIEGSLYELAPACTLELLGMPHTLDNVERRHRGISALRVLLHQGLDVEASCQVQDWPCFLAQALGKLMAAEIVDLLPWENLAAARKNKKSLESQNQRVVIDFDCFYMVLIAHIALGFSSRQKDLISKASTLCDCMTASDGIDLKLEEAICLFLLGQGNEGEALEKLRQLDMNSGPRNSILGLESKSTSAANPSLEKWLKDSVLGLFPDTQDCSPSLTKFFSQEKKPVGIWQCKGTPHPVSGVSSRPLPHAFSSDRKVVDERFPSAISSQHLGAAVQQLAPPNLQGPLQETTAGLQASSSSPSSQLTREFGWHRSRDAESLVVLKHFVERITFITSVGCIVFAGLKLFGLWNRGMNGYKWENRDSNVTINSRHTDQGIDIADMIKKLSPNFIVKLGTCEIAKNHEKSTFTASPSSPLPEVDRRPMPLEEAEALVRQWQNVKADALGPDHQVSLLFDVLDERMLLQWEALADAAKDKSCYWRFVLLQLSILRAEIFSDSINSDVAEIEVLLEEAAELVDESQPKNSNYYSTYRIVYTLRRQDDDSWKFLKADIQSS